MTGTELAREEAGLAARHTIELKLKFTYAVIMYG